MDVVCNQYGDMASFKDSLCAAYPDVPLKQIGFQLCRLGKGRRVVEITPEPTTMNEMRDALGRSKLIVVPLLNIAETEVCRCACCLTIVSLISY